MKSITSVTLEPKKQKKVYIFWKVHYTLFYPIEILQIAPALEKNINIRISLRQLFYKTLILIKGTIRK